jgi:alpha-glutamyl/putrescinyl thymine pyrophosphorylase clade 1
MFLQHVKKLSPFDLLVYWIKERESIRLKREAGEPRPWTDDEILNTYRFCNVRRMDDAVSKWLYDNWYHPYFNHSNMLYAIALARFINKPESLELITPLVFRDKGAPSWERIKTKLRKHRDTGNTVFNCAYMVRGNDGIDKIECVVDYYVKPMKKILKKLDTYSMENTHRIIHSSFGMGSFMAGQIVADARWAIAGLWYDRCQWAPIGPGSSRGMRRLHSEPLKPLMNQEDFIGRLQRLMEELRPELPKSYMYVLEAHDYQNCLCEYDKYCRVLNGDGRPKMLFRSAS